MKPTDTASLIEHLGTLAAVLSYEALRVRLAALHIVVDLAAIEAWSLEDYAAVVAYVGAVKTKTINRPAVLPPVDNTPPLPKRRRLKPAPQTPAHV